MIDIFPALRDIVPGRHLASPGRLSSPGDESACQPTPCGKALRRSECLPDPSV